MSKFGESLGTRHVDRYGGPLPVNDCNGVHCAMSAYGRFRLLATGLAPIRSSADASPMRTTVRSVELPPVPTTKIAAGQETVEGGASSVAGAGGACFVIAASMPCISATGVGGQPGTATSTGTTLDTRPQLA